MQKGKQSGPSDPPSAWVWPAGPRSEEPLLGPPSHQQLGVGELQALVRGRLSDAARGLPVGLEPRARPQSCLSFPSLRGTLSGGRAGRKCPGNRPVGAATSPGHLNQPQSRQTDRQEVGFPGRLRGLSCMAALPSSSWSGPQPPRAPGPARPPQKARPQQPISFPHQALPPTP